MTHPRFTLRNQFRPIAMMTGESGGIGTSSADLLIQALIAGASEGLSQAEAQMVLRALCAGASAGVGTATGDLYLDPPTVYHLVIIGQSNGVGEITRGTNRTPEPAGLMFNNGVQPGGVGLTSFVEMVDKERQTIAPTFAAQMKELLGPRLFLVSIAANSGSRYSALKKGTIYYSNSIAQITAAKALAAASGMEYQFLGIVCVHGETDDQFNDQNYESYLLEWQADYQADINAAIGRTGTLPIYFFQHSAYDFDDYGHLPPLYTGSTKIATYNVCAANPTTHKLIGPQYYYDSGDGLHHSSAWRRIQGEIVAKWLYRDIFDGGFTMFKATSAVLSGTTIDVTFQVPVPPLTWDYVTTTYFKDGGFTFRDSSGFITVNSAAIIGDNVVRLTLASASSGTDRRLLYAGMHPGSSEPKYYGAHGNLCDSDTFVSRRGHRLRNYCPHFNIPVTT